MFDIEWLMSVFAKVDAELKGEIPLRERLQFQQEQQCDIPICGLVVRRVFMALMLKGRQG